MKKNTYFQYSILFIALTVICFFCFWHNGILPIYGIDGIGQYYPAFLYTGQYLRDLFDTVTKSGSVNFFDLSIGMGEDIIGTLNYYGFGDPLNILAVFATKQSGPYVFAFMYHLRMYLGGLAFMFYCRRFRMSDKAVVIAAISYSFCGYAVFASGMYVQYGSMLYVFPLILTGCERVFHRERGRSLLFFSALYLGLCGFYFTYMCSLFLVPYTLIRLYFLGGKEKLKVSGMSILECLLLYITGLCCAAPILLPSVMMFLTSSRSDSFAVSQLLRLSNYIPVLNRRFVSDANIMNAMRNYPVMICAAALFVLPTGKRITQLRIAVAALLIMLYLPITAIVMNGFADPRDRWVFEAQFVLCVAFAVVLDELQKPQYKRLQNLAAILSIVGIAAAFWARYSSLGDDQKQLFVTADQAMEHTRSVVSASAVISSDNGLFRVSGEFVSSVNERPLNDGMINAYYGTNYWFSIVNADTQEFVDETTGKDNDWRSFGLGRDNENETMAGVKYYLSKTGNAPDAFVIKESFDANDGKWSVYSNPYYRGFAYIADPKGNTDGTAVDCSYSGNDLSCVITGDVAEDCELVTALLYSWGWSAYINGVKTDTNNRSHFLSVDAKGLHKGDTVLFRYISPGFYGGLIAAFAGLMMFAVRSFVMYILRKRAA